MCNQYLFKTQITARRNLQGMYVNLPLSIIKSTLQRIRTLLEKQSHSVIQDILHTSWKLKVDYYLG